MPVFNNALAGAAGSGGADAGFKIERSLRFNKNDAAHLNKTFSAGNRRTWTWSGWAKLSTLSGGRNLWACYNGTYNIDDFIQFYVGSDATFIVYVGSSVAWKSNEVFRDPSAWYHFVISFDTTRSSANDILKVWVNGQQITRASGAGFSLNTDYAINNTIPHRIGTYNGSSELFDGYMAEIHFLDGIAVNNPDGVFGEFDADTGVWNPIEANFTSPNNGTTWSNSGSSSATLENGNWGQVFDGTRYMYSGSGPSNGPAISNGTITFSPSGLSGRVITAGVRGGSNKTYTVNGSAMTFGSGNAEVATIDLGSVQSITSVVGTSTASGTWAQFYWIAVDGVLLVDGAGKYGINGFNLDFSDNSSNAALGNDAAGSNNWTVNNISAQASTHAIAGTHQGKPGISFNGTNAEINISSDADVNPGSGEFTFECYAYSNSNSSEFGIYDGSPGGAGSLVIRRVGSGTLMVERHNQAFDITGAQFSQNTWHHVAVTRDSSNNVRLFVDGNQSGSTSTNNTHNYQGLFRLGRTNNGFTQGYISSLRLIKGACLYTSNFSPPSGTLGNYLTTKLLMAQSTTSATAATVKPSGVTITGSGDSSSIDSLLDSPTNYEASSGNNGGNYCTLNPLQKSSEVTLSNGNLDVSTSSTSNKCKVFGTMAVTSGKWYYEVTIGSNYRGSFGWATDPNSNLAQQPGDSSGDYALTFDGQKIKSGTYTGSYGTAYSSGMVIGIRLDATAGTVAFSQDGVDKGNAYTGQTDLTWWPIVGDASSGGTFNGSVNFGQRPFAHTPPTGYKSLCTQNLDDPLIADGSDYFDAKLWTGNGGEQIVGGGIRYSDYVTGDIDSSFPAYRAFRNTTNQTGVRTQTANGATIVFQPPSPIEFSSSFKIWAARDSTSATFTVTHAGGTTDFSSSVATGTTQTAVDLAQISGVTSPITKITIVSTGTNPRFSGIEVDGSMLIDSTADPINFSPDFTWIKQRSTTRAHALFDTVRGANKRLQSSSTGTETTHTDQLTAFSSDSFTVGSNNTVNADTGTYVAWNWDGGALASNSAYNQSQNWTSLLTSSAGTINNPGNSFDGSTTTTSQLPSTSAGSYIQLGATLTGVTKLEVYQRSASDVSGTGIQTYNNCPAAQWVQLTLTSSTISNIRFEKNTNDPGIYAIRVNDKILVDPGLIPVGSLNSTVYNQSQTWSTSGTISNFNTSGTYDFAHLFNGVLGQDTPGTDNQMISPSGGSGTWTYTINNVTEFKIRLYVPSSTHATANSIKINGSDIVQAQIIDKGLTNDAWHTVTVPGITTFTSLFVEDNYWYVSNIYINGKELIDNGVSVTNVPSIASTVRANQTAGFSIVTATQGSNNSTWSHGLNKKPDFIVMKAKDQTYGWYVSHSGLDNQSTKFLRLDNTNGVATNSNWFASTEPTSSVITTKAGGMWSSGDDFLALCWTAVEGYSAFGSYTGSGSQQFIHLGFKPAWVMIKRHTDNTVGEWGIYDSTRAPYNEIQKKVWANNTSGEEDHPNNSIDFVSNGFVVDPGSNAPNVQYTNNGNVGYLYIAFAENPFKTARAR